MNKTETAFFILLRAALGTSKPNENIPLLTEQEWEDLYDLSKKQTLTGVILEGIKQLKADQMPPKKVLLKWFTNVERIKEKNKELNLAAIKVTAKFRKDGFRSAILKGQGVAQYYPDPSIRIPGDIDIWLDGTRKEILQYIRKYCPNVGARYHHIDFPVMKQVDIEVHFTPTWMNSFSRNKYLQNLFTSWKEEVFEHQIKLPECDGYICTPTDKMNRIFLLIHIYHHFFDEGIGLRQLTDYFYLLKRDCADNEKKEFQSIVEQLGIKKFTQALMYIMHEILGLEKELLLLEPNEKDGRFLLQEILITGNFGHTDKRINRENGKSIAFYWSKFTHKIHFFSSYPKDILNNISFWIWQYFWRKKNGYM